MRLRKFNRPIEIIKLVETFILVRLNFVNLTFLNKVQYWSERKPQVNPAIKSRSEVDPWGRQAQLNFSKTQC